MIRLTIGLLAVLSVESIAGPWGVIEAGDVVAESLKLVADGLVL